MATRSLQDAATSTAGGWRLAVSGGPHSGQLRGLHDVHRSAGLHRQAPSRCNPGQNRSPSCLPSTAIGLDL